MEDQNFIDLPSPVEQEQEQQTEQLEQDLGVTPEVPASPATVEPAPQEAPEQAAPAPQEEPQEREAGQDGSVRDVAGAVGQALEGLNDPTFMTKASDAVAGFLGLGTPEERQQQREEGAAKIKENAQKAIEADPVGAAVADTLVRAVPGGALDAVEDALSAAEVIGDTAKTFASLGTVHPSQNPFSDKYDWAQWKLGADEIGATTPVGQFAQELVSFAAIGSRLGAFKSFSGAANATTKLGKAGQVLKTGAVEAFYGMATDAIKGLAGEGNFANMIEQIMPGLKDTWVTALAVDEDDNPWESAVKSALDGAALGFPTGAIGAVAAGTRAAKGKVGQEAMDAFTEGYTKQIELDIPKTKVKNGFDYADALGKASRGEHDMIRWEGASESQIESISNAYGLGAGENMPLPRAEGVQQKIPALELAENRVETKVPVYWDDLAATMPEMFTPGNRAVQPDFAQSVYDQLRAMDSDGGGTFDPFTGEVPESGTMVAIDGVSLESIEPDAVQNFIADNYDILSREDVYLGAWVSEITGKPVVELSRRIDDFETASQLGKAFDQEGIFRMEDFSYHNTGGIDKLKETKGFHQRSAYTTTNYLAAPVEPQKIAKNLFTPGAPEGVSGGRLYTDSQIEKLAEATDTATAKQMDEVLQKIGVSEDDILSQAKITRAELRENVIDDLASFIEDDGSLKKALLNTEDWGGEQVLTRQGQLQARILVKNLAGRINEITRTISSKNAQGISSTTELENLVNHVRWVSKLRKRTVNALSIRLGDEAMDLNVQGAQAAKKQADDMAKQVEAINIVDKELGKMLDGLKSGDPKRVRQAQRTAQMLELTGGDLNKMMRVTKGIPALYADVALKHMYNSLLSAGATHVVNTTSSIMQTLLRPMTATIGGKPGAAQASFYGFAKNISESWSMAMRAAKDPSAVQGSKMVQNSELEMALNANFDKAVAENNIGAQNHIAFLRMMHSFAEFPVLSWPSKLLTTSDEFFKAMNARMEYNVRSYMEAQELASITPGAKQETIFKELVEKNKQYNFGKETGQIINGELLDVAKELTFQTDMAGPVGKFMTFLEDAPYLRPFFPFVKTGHNIMVYTATHTPVLNMALSESRRALRGDLGPYAQAVHRGRVAMGSMFAVTAGLAAAGGILTGSGPKDPQRRSEWMKTHQPRSIKIGDKWVSYDRIEPFGQILSAMADITHMVTYDGLEEDKAQYLGQYLIYAVSSNFTDKSFFQGIGQLAELINPGSAGGGGTKATTAALNVINNFIPAAGLRRATVNGITAQMQEYYNNYDRVLIQMGLGSMVKPPADKKSWLDGSTIDSASAGWWNALSPIKVVERGQDVVSDALEDIEFESRAVREELGGLKLHPEHQTRLNELIAESGVHAKIKAWVTDPKFQESIDQHKADMAAGKSTIPKKKQLYYSTIHRILSKAQTQALPFLLDEYPELAEQFHANKDLENRAKYGYVEGLLNTEY